MGLDYILRTIESPAFAVELNLVAGRAAFSRELRQHPELLELVKEIRSTNEQNVLLDRVKLLSSLQIDERYENEADVALSAYLIALSETASPNVTKEAAEVASLAQNCWWTSQIAREVHSSASRATGSGQLWADYWSAFLESSAADWQASLSARWAEMAMQLETSKLETLKILESAAGGPWAETAMRLAAAEVATSKIFNNMTASLARCTIVAPEAQAPMLQPSPLLTDRVATYRQLLQNAMAPSMVVTRAHRLTDNRLSPLNGRLGGLENPLNSWRDAA